MKSMDDFRKCGYSLIDELKKHVLSGLSLDHRGSRNGTGLGNSELDYAAWKFRSIGHQKENRSIG